MAIQRIKNQFNKSNVYNYLYDIAYTAPVCELGRTSAGTVQNEHWVSWNIFTRLARSVGGRMAVQQVIPVDQKNAALFLSAEFKP